MGSPMAAVAKKIHFAFDIGERVWLVCDINTSGIVDGYRIGDGFLPRYIIAFPNGKSVHADHELTRDEPNPYLPDTTEDE